jgi:hypothetical protein
VSGFLARKFGRQPSKAEAFDEVRSWLDVLDVQIPVPPPIVLRWDDMAEIPLDEATDDDLIIHPDQPTRDDLACAVVSMVRDADETFPGPWHPSRWTWLHKTLMAVESWVPITFLGCSSSSGGDPVDGWVYSYRRPRWSTFYVLGKPRWWWECLHRQSRGGEHRWHRPIHPFAFGMCARCVPCPDCGAPYDCYDGCPSLAPSGSVSQ